jgi:hypothetical protein
VAVLFLFRRLIGFPDTRILQRISCMMMMISCVIHVVLVGPILYLRQRIVWATFRREKMS